VKSFPTLQGTPQLIHVLLPTHGLNAVTFTHCPHRYQFIYRVLIDYMEKRFARASRALLKGSGKLSKGEVDRGEMDDIEREEPHFNSRSVHTAQFC